MPAEGGSGGVVERHSEGFEWEQQVGEKNGGVEVEILDGPEGGIAGELGLLAEIDERMGAAEFLVVAVVTTGLAHEPDWGAAEVAALEGGDEEAHEVGRVS